MKKSPGAEKLRKEFYKRGGNNLKGFVYGTFEAAYDTLLNPKTADWCSTAAQVGGFAGAEAINNNDGTVTFRIVNIAGTKSFFYHLFPNRSGTKGPMRSIVQIFEWVEKIDENRLQKRK